MPNTLAHLGLAGLLTRRLCRDADFRWIYLGAVIPDVPWIFQRIISRLLPDLNLLDLRLYAVVQATLFFSLILSGGVALLTKGSRKTFFILGFGVFFHLILDAVEVKWANGVHLFAPLDWRLFQFALTWPDALPTNVVTGIGLIYVALNWRKTGGAPPVRFNSVRHLYGGVCILVVYFLLPFFFLNASEAEDNHFVKTLRQVENRQGKPIEFDRAFYQYESSDGKLRVFNGEELNLVGLELRRSAQLSIRGVFLDSNTVEVNEYHLHSPHFRDNASYLGLSLIAILWGWSGLQRFRPNSVRPKKR